MRPDALVLAEVVVVVLTSWTHLSGDEYRQALGDGVENEMINFKKRGAMQSCGTLTNRIDPCQHQDVRLHIKCCVVVTVNEPINLSTEGVIGEHERSKRSMRTQVLLEANEISNVLTVLPTLGQFPYTSVE